MTNCIACGNTFSNDRAKLGFKTCLDCGEKQANQVKHCVAPMHKSNYMLFTRTEDLKGINNKGGLIK
jgi:predicted  nucleic acid-binding Zn-ribbon protein